MICTLLFLLDKPKEIKLLPPTDKTIIKGDMELLKGHLNKKKWHQMLHQSDSFTNWKKIEADLAYNQYLETFSEDALQEKDGQINIGGGILRGTWKEKGSNNLAGSITAISFDYNTHLLYVMSDGGSLWRGTLDGLNWEIFEQDLRFDKRFLNVINIEQETRVVTAINGIPHFKDENQPWKAAIDIETSSIIESGEVISINSGNDIFFLSKLNTNKVGLFYSNDKAFSFQKIREFNVQSLQDISIQSFSNNDSDFYIIEKKSNGNSRIYEWSESADKINLINDNSSLQFKENDQTNVQIQYDGLNKNLFAFSDNTEYRKSENEGQSWTYQSQLPVKPWGNEIFISRINPNVMILSEIEAHKSIDGGLTWHKINEWPDYYANPSVNLHADIMCIKEFSFDNKNVIVIGNHGGLSVSYDGGINFQNIGLHDLNVSQYYSVATHPTFDNYIFTGSQDQGIQRTFDFDEGTANFTQMFSGDYGHVTFTNNNNSLWTVFPGGLVVYFDDPIGNNSPTTSYFPDFPTKTVWLPQITKVPNRQNSVVLAGGSTSKENSSHVIQLEYGDLGGINVTEWPFNFANGNGELSAISFNSNNSDIVYAGTTDGRFYISNDHGETFTQRQIAANNDYFYCNKILNSRRNPNRIFAIGSGYSNSPIFISEDGGETFNSLQLNLPHTVIFDIALYGDESFLFAATESGPYMFSFQTNLWYDIKGSYAPLQRYWDVEYIAEKSKVRFATFGRGIWDLDVDYLSSSSSGFMDQDISLYPNPTSDFINLKFDNLQAKSLTVVNSEGAIMQKFQSTFNSQSKIDVSHFPNGIYYLIFEEENSKNIKKFIKI